MPIELRLPNINGMTEKEQLAQIRSYLYQFIPQLQWALNNVTTTSSTTAVTPTKSTVVAGGASSVTPETTFNAIKSLIIKSADIVDAYYDVINKKLEGLYVAESVFGKYTQETTQQITETSTSITRYFENIQTIESNINDTRDSIDGVKGDIDSVRGDIDGTRADIDSVRGDISSVNAAISATNEAVAQIKKTEAYVRTGEIDTAADGNPIVGVEIGQTDTENGNTFERFARFTADRLEFYHKSEYPIAYISGYKLYITNAEILGELKLGNYVFDTSNGLILKWVEGA